MPAASIEAKIAFLKDQGFTEVVPCFGGIGCLLMRRSDEFVTIAQPTTDEAITMPKDEWIVLCNKIRSGEIQ